jgi:cytochrome c biogenesis protein CcdA
MRLSLRALPVLFVLFAALGSPIAGAPSASGEKLTVHFFGSRTCGQCLEIKHDLLYPLKDQYPEKLDIQIHDIENEESFQLMITMEEEYDVVNSSPQELFLPDTFLTGYDDIMTHGGAMIRDYLEHPERWSEKAISVDAREYESELRERFQSFTFLGILAAGLVDGVNPCAIATMIFLISFLATQKRKRSEVLIIGLSFTAAVYCTYLLLGIGAFRALTLLDQYRWVSQVIRWGAVGAAGIVAILSFWDAFSYKKTGRTDAITLQLPKPLKLRIHKVISGNLKSSQLVTGAIATGFLVTLLEAVCTGQVYLPTIVLMTRSSGLAVTGWLYLLFYNFLFVLPLLVVMILAYFGLTWNRLAKTTQKNLATLKILLGVVMCGLAAFLALA